MGALLVLLLLAFCCPYTVTPIQAPPHAAAPATADYRTPGIEDLHKQQPQHLQQKLQVQQQQQRHVQQHHMQLQQQQKQQPLERQYYYSQQQQQRPGQGKQQYYSQHHQQLQHYQQYYRTGERESPNHEDQNHHQQYRAYDEEATVGRSLADGIVEGQQWEEEVGWWDGVEEVDLTQRPPHSSPLPSSSFTNHQRQHTETQIYFVPLSAQEEYDQENMFQHGDDNDEKVDIPFHFFDCGDDDYCEIGEFPPPPDLFVPPPPMPPFMTGPGSLASISDVTSVGEDPGRDCSLCHWAMYGNTSATFSVQEHEVVSSNVSGLLAGVAVGSAVTGALLTAVLIACRRSRVPSSDKDSCPILPRGFWIKSGNRVERHGPSKPPVPQPSSAETAATTAATAISATGTEIGAGTGSLGDEEASTRRTGWAMKLWRRGSSQERPLRPSSSYSSENSYTEEPYGHPDAQSAVYAELAQGLNTYSEIPDPGGPFAHRLTTASDYGYGNSAYALSEATSELAESSSTPSSAYYSDVSTDAQASKKKRKKKKGNEREVVTSNCNFATIPSNISSTIPILGTRLGESMMPLPPGEHLCRASAIHEALPISLRFIPHSYSLERQGLTYSCTPCHACTSLSSIPILKHACDIPTAMLFSANRHGALCADNHGVLSANNHGVINANNHGVLSANTHGVINANNHGVLSANNHGVLSANTHGVINTNTPESLFTSNSTGPMVNHVNSCNDPGLVFTAKPSQPEQSLMHSRSVQLGTVNTSVGLNNNNNKSVVGEPGHTGPVGYRDDPRMICRQQQQPVQCPSSQYV